MLWTLPTRRWYPHELNPWPASVYDHYIQDFMTLNPFHVYDSDHHPFIFRGLRDRDLCFGDVDQPPLQYYAQPSGWQV